MICNLVEELVQQWASSVAGPDEMTLILENIPEGWGSQEAVDWINESGFAGEYDLFHLSQASGAQGDEAEGGTAIINFVDEKAAERFEEELNGTLVGPRHVVAVTMSFEQGLAKNVRTLVRSGFSREAVVLFTSSLPHKERTASKYSTICQLIEQLVKQYASSIASPAEMTLVLENIPGAWANEDVVGWIDENGFGGTYDLFHLSRSGAARGGSSTAVINFVDEGVAERFEEELNGTFLGPRHVAAMTLSFEQGLAENLLTLVHSQFVYDHSDRTDSQRMPSFQDAPAQSDWYSEASIDCWLELEREQEEFLKAECYFEEDTCASAWLSSSTNTGQQHSSLDSFDSMQDF